LVPIAGVRNSFFAAAALLFLAAGLFAGRSPAALAVILPAGLAWLPAPPPRPVLVGEERLFAGETRYQFVEILRREKTRSLRVNEGLDSYQSLYVEDSPWTGAYYDLFALAPLLAEPSVGQTLRVLVLGLGGGTVSRLYHALFADAFDLSIDGVELDSGLVDAARGHFGLEEASHPRLRVLSGWDGRAALSALPGPYEVVVLDAYAQQIHIPPHLATLECFEAVREKLVPGGILIANVGGFGFEDPVVASIAATMARAFDAVEAVAVRDARNVVLFAARGVAPDLAGAYRRAQDGELRRLASYAAVPSVRRRFAAEDGPLLSDAASRLDLLAVRSLWERSLRR
jgi:spermidine synthase